MEEENRSDSHGHLHRDGSNYTYSKTNILNFCMNYLGATHVKQRNSVVAPTRKAVAADTGT